MRRRAPAARCAGANAPLLARKTAIGRFQTVSVAGATSPVAVGSALASRVCPRTRDGATSNTTETNAFASSVVRRVEGRSIECAASYLKVPALFAQVVPSRMTGRDRESRDGESHRAGVPGRVVDQMRQHRFVLDPQLALTAGWLLLALLAVPAAGQPEGSAPAAATPEDRALIETAPVFIDGERLFAVRGVSSYPAAYRAGIIAGRIRELAHDPAVDPATIQIVDGERDSRIAAGDRPVMSVLDADEAVEGVDRRILAQVYVERIRAAVVGYRAARTREALLQSTWRAGALTILAVALLWVLRRGLKALRSLLERRYHARVRAVSVGSFEVVRQEQLWGMVQSAVSIIGAASVVLVLFLYLRRALALFPWTRGIASQLTAWALDPLTKLGSALVDMLPNLFFLAVLFVLTRAVLRVMRLFFSAAARPDAAIKGFHAEWAEPTYRLARLLVVALAIVVAYPYIPGSSSPAFRGISLFAGVLFSLGSTSAVANLIAGYILVYRRTFHEGDVVKIGDVVGRVTLVRLQVTHIRTIKNEEIIVPNSTIVNSEVINYSSLAATDGLILHTTVGIGYETPWRQVEAMLLEAAARTPGIRQEPKPFVLQTELGDFAITHQINVYCDTARTMAITRAALHRCILDVFNEYGVQIMTPAYEGDPEQPKIVPKEQWHTAPAAKPG